MLDHILLVFAADHCFFKKTFNVTSWSSSTRSIFSCRLCWLSAATRARRAARWRAPSSSTCSRASMATVLTRCCVRLEWTGFVFYVFECPLRCHSLFSLRIGLTSRWFATGAKPLLRRAAAHVFSLAVEAVPERASAALTAPDVLSELVRVVVAAARRVADASDPLVVRVRCE